MNHAPLFLLPITEEKYDFILQASQYTIPDIMNAYPDSASMQTAACIFLKNLARTGTPVYLSIRHVVEIE